jgi:phospholipid/cholesterol/gamma-HCH transport system permease protein
MIAWLGARTLQTLQLAGSLALVSGRMALHLPRLDRREFKRALVQAGWSSLGLAIGVALLGGAAVVLQTGPYTVRFGARAQLGWAASYSLTWEFGPLLLGLVMAARVGARHAAELAALKVSGQLEGLRAVSLDPYRLLIAPRALGALLAIAAVAHVGLLVALLSCAAMARLTLEIPMRVFLGSMAGSLGIGDLIGGLIKSCAFALAISLVSTAAGLRALQGARAVGRAAAAAVAWSSGSIFALDFALTPVIATALGS